MTMAAAIENPMADAKTWSGRIAGIELVHDLAGAEAVWRGLEHAGPSCTPFQRFDFVQAWQRNVGTQEGLTPLIVIATDAERRPLMLLPLAVRHAYGARCASF